jgi:glycerol uptake facilitator-like aquaporin
VTDTHISQAPAAQRSLAMPSPTHDNGASLTRGAGYALARHWPEYLMESAELGMFMISACFFTALLEYPASPALRLIPNSFVRNALIGLAMALTAASIIYSGWGKQSGAHMNPAMTLTFFRLGKVEPWDALFYVSKKWAPYTGLFGGALIASYITFEAPLSGMSMNPARTLGSALLAKSFDALWLYFVAPPIGMLAAAEVYVRLRSIHAVHCAKYHHNNNKRCIFRCRFAELQNPKILGTTS